jgi:hypothetical protein
MDPEPDFIVEPDQVAEHHACPQCGERRMDFLVWQPDLDDMVNCQT